MNKWAIGGLLGLMSLTTARGAEPAAVPADHGKRGGFLAQMDFDYGGDEIATVYYEDDESQDVKAGQGIALSVGGWFRPVASAPFEIQASIGIKYATTMASNADINVSRTLLQLEGVYRFPNGMFVGAGLMHHMNPKLDGDGFFESVSFDDASGLNLEVGWRWFSLHYANLTYGSEDFEDVDASHFGVRFTYPFGQDY